MRALVLSGGGVHGAFQVGVLEHLIKDLKHRYQIFCGISVGALNTGFLSMYRPIAQGNAYENLRSLWMSIDNSKVRRHWVPFGPLHALWKKSYYNSEALGKLVESKLSPNRIKESGNRLCVGAVALETGEYKIFREDYSNICDAVLASSAFPMMLTPVEMEGKLWIDGGVREMTPLKNAIELGADEIDVVMTAPSGMSPSYQNYKTVKIGLRTLEIVMAEIIDNDIRVAMLINELVSKGTSDKKYVKINIYRPNIPLDGDPLDFDPETIRKEIALGYETASQA